MAMLTLAAFAGCGYRPPYSCVKVSGKITYEDGSLIPAKRIRLIFLSQAAPLDQRTLPKDGIAEVNVKTGQFSTATTFDYKDGIIAGEHKVLLECFGAGGARSKLVPDAYADADKTPLKVKTGDSPFVLKVPKPR